jgi:putative cardiolipin synthase
VLARDLRAEHARLSDPARSWRVTLERGRLRWTGCHAPHRGSVTLGHEPGASLRRRALAGLVRLLPVEAQL